MIAGCLYQLVPHSHPHMHVVLMCVACHVRSSTQHCMAHLCFHAGALMTAGPRWPATAHVCRAACGLQLVLNHVVRQQSGHSMFIRRQEEMTSILRIVTVCFSLGCVAGHALSCVRSYV
jgi:hypothetical protein